MSERAKGEDIEALVEIFQASDWKELRLRFKDVDIFLSKDADARVVQNIERSDAASSRRNAPKPRAASRVAPVPEIVKDEPEADTPGHWTPVRAPNLGTFYRAPKPGASPFVELDQKVDADTEICLIEVMKLFTAVKAGTAGTIRRICAKDGELIENGKILFYLEPDGQ